MGVQIAQDYGDPYQTSPAEAHRGQARMAYRLAEAYAGRLLYVNGIGWHWWDGRRWAEDLNGQAKRAVLDVLRTALTESLEDPELRKDVRKCETSAGVNGVLEIGAALEQFAVTVTDLDPDPYLLNCSNCTLDLRTMEVRRHDPADRITKVCGAAFRPDAQGPRWEQFLTEVLPDPEVRSFLRRYVGVALAGTVLEHVLAILTGVGRNGKGVFYGSVSQALGDYADTAEPDLFMHREGAHPTGEMDLRGVRWVVVSETDQGRRLAEATVKRLTGGDEIKARRMRQDFVKFRPSHTAALVTNHLPKVSTDPALWRRLRVVPFNVVIPPEREDHHLGEQLELELDAILTWCIAGWADYQRRGGLAEPDAVRAATDAYRTSADTVQQFLDEECIVNPHMRVSVADLWTRWNAWCADGDVPPGSKKAFGTELDNRGFITKKSGGWWRLGLGLLAEEDADDNA